MGLFTGSKPSIPTRNFPEVKVPEDGVYEMIVENFSKPFTLTDKCYECKGTGAIEGETCQKCAGEGKQTLKKMRIRYSDRDTYAEEDVTWKLSAPWTNKAGKTVKASTLFLRLRELTGIDDVDLLEGVDHEKLIGANVRVTIIPSSNGRYLRIAHVKRNGPAPASGKGRATIVKDADPDIPF